MGIREEADSDLAEIFGDTDGAGTPYTLIDKDEAEFPVAGTFGDVGYLLNPDTGIPIVGRTITASYRIKALLEKTEKVPGEGWKVKVIDLNGIEQTFYVTKYEPDRTIGLARIRVAAK
jgi:hypothetical protein